MASPTGEDLDDPDEGQGDEAAYDGLAVEHMNSPAGIAELAEHRPPGADDEVQA